MIPAWDLVKQFLFKIKYEDNQGTFKFRELNKLTDSLRLKASITDGCMINVLSSFLSKNKFMNDAAQVLEVARFIETEVRRKRFIDDLSWKRLCERWSVVSWRHKDVSRINSEKIKSRILAELDAMRGLVDSKADGEHMHELLNDIEKSFTDFTSKESIKQFFFFAEGFYEAFDGLEGTLKFDAAGLGERFSWWYVRDNEEWIPEIYFISSQDMPSQCTDGTEFDEESVQLLKDKVFTTPSNWKELMLELNEEGLHIPMISFLRNDLVSQMLLPATMKLDKAHFVLNSSNTITGIKATFART